METIKAGLGLSSSDSPSSTEPVSGKVGGGSAAAPYDAGNDSNATEAAERERTTEESGSTPAATSTTETGTNTKSQSIVSSVIDSVVNQIRGTSLTGSKSQNVDNSAVDANPPPAPPGEREELRAEPDTLGPATDYENARARPVSTSAPSATVDVTSTSGEPPAPPGEKDDPPTVPATSGAPNDYEDVPVQPATSATANSYSTGENRAETEVTTVSDPAPAGEREEPHAVPATSGAPVDYEETRAQPMTTSSSDPSSDESGTATTRPSEDEETATTKSETESESKSSRSGGDTSGKPKENPSAIPTAGGIRLGEKNVP